MKLFAVNYVRVIMGKVEIIIGIYRIFNKITQQSYIGSSKHIKQRLYKHKCLLNKNKHNNQFLQNSVNKHGLENFIFEIIEICDFNVLEEREQYYIDKYGYYNLTKIVKRNILSKESRLKQSETRKKLAKEGKLPRTNNPINQYDLNGNYIKTWDAIIDASRELNIHPTTIIRNLQGVYKQGKGFIWKYIDDNSEIIPYFGKKREFYIDLVKSGEFRETPEVDNPEPSTNLND